MCQGIQPKEQVPQRIFIKNDQLKPQISSSHVESTMESIIVRTAWTISKTNSLFVWKGMMLMYPNQNQIQVNKPIKSSK